MIRAGHKLSKYSDKQLGQLVASTICMGVDGDELSAASDSYIICRARPMVRMAAAAFDLLVQKNTTRSTIEPSQESRAWSDLEGGHLFHVEPVINIEALICGYLDLVISGPGRIKEAL